MIPALRLSSCRATARFRLRLCRFRRIGGAAERLGPIKKDGDTSPPMMGRPPLEFDTLAGTAKKSAKLEALHPWPQMKNAVLHALPLLCARGGWNYAEVWIPNDDMNALVPVPEWYSDKTTDIAWTTPDRYENASFEIGSGLPGRAYLTQNVVSLSSVPEEELGVHALKKDIMKSIEAVPLLTNGMTYCVLVFFAKKASPLLQAEIATFRNFANGLILSSVTQGADVQINIPGISQEKIRAVYNLILSEGVFNSLHIYQEVDWFYRIGMPNSYFEMFDGHQIAQHIHCLIAAKKVAQAMATPENINVKMATEHGLFFILPASYSDIVRVESEIESLIEATPEGHSFSLTNLCSEEPAIPGGKHPLSVYVTQTDPYVCPSVGFEESNIWLTASGAFLRETSLEIRQRYQELLKEAVNNISTVFRIHETSKDGSMPISVSLRHAQRSSFLLKFTEVLKYNRLPCRKKYIQTFSNGIVIYTFYLKTQNRELVHKFLNELHLLSLVTGTSMRQLFLSGHLDVVEYTYASGGRKFIYYFLNRRSEEFDILAKALKTDQASLGRLNLLATKLRREAVTHARITQAMFDETALISKLFKDFERCCRDKPSYNQALHAEILKTAKNEINAQILQAFLVFNSHILKTNFWRPAKAALCFSLDGSFIEAALYPENPYVIFFVLSQEFQGFHIRFRDVARGGIRLIKSPNRNAFVKNIESQFLENYNLAHTQNMKNKDIPEFGSKGTVLLYRGVQENVAIAFQKYISALLDLLVINPGDDVIDHYKKQELLFLGPDENTADLMEWAARYARTRGYTFWKAFTTGKSPALGGIPHDTYGMTTQSVHSYVLGVLDKLSLKEEEITKVQTGGPDGDLGSNEILISKDRTVAVVDGSGVLYDPEGLNREELVRLAKTRKTISFFDVSKLSSKGFRVLITDTDVTLPTGEVVESGLTFRNEFHLHELSTATLFVPCGGRPASINLETVNRLIDPLGQPKFKIIVEGANLFLTQEARDVLEDAGVILYKDASANKGGVTSSSLEVLAALAMTDEEHETHMQVKESEAIPPFYKEYVTEIQQIIKENARLEFECIWSEHERTGVRRHVLTDQVSQKINSLADVCQASMLYDNTPLRTAVLKRAVPRRLQQLKPLEAIVQQLPENYCRAIFAAWLSSHFVYKYGVASHDFAFFEFVSSLLAAEGES